MALRLFFADDIFISYARKDSSTYASGLADELTKRGFSCFIDRLGTETSAELPDSLRRKVRSCALMVVVGTQWSGTRPSIKKEIAEFRKTKHPIVPIDVDGSLFDAIWCGEVEGIAPELEHNPLALDDGIPSPSVLSRIEKAFTYQRRNQRLRRWTVATAVVLTLLIAASVVAAGIAASELKRAEQSRVEAVRARDEAEQARSEALAARADAERARAEALDAQGEATRATSAAAEQQRIAAAATEKAQTQTQLAAAAATRASEATNVARQQEGIAIGRRAAASADAYRAKSVQSDRNWVDLLEYSTLLSVEAAKRLSNLGVPPSESDRSLRASLDLLPRSVRTFERQVDDVLISPDGKYLITKEGDFARVWDTANLTQISDDIKLDNGNVTFNRDRTLMALTDSDGGVSVLELPKGKRRWRLEKIDQLLTDMADKIPAFQFSPDGKYVAASVTAASPSVGADKLLHRVGIWPLMFGKIRFVLVYR